jgi:NADH-quinone oxidoreductase subunit N
MNQSILIAPEILLSLVGLAVLVGEAFAPQQRRLWVYVSIAALVACIVHQALFFAHGAFPGAAAYGLAPTSASGGWIAYANVFGVLSIDSLAVFFKIALLSSIVMVLWLSADYFEFDHTPMGTYCGLLLFATVGMMLLVSSTDLLMAVIGLELLSITSFILTGFAFGRRSSGEAAIKFFLVGALSTAILLFGISYYYGYFGTTRMEALQAFPAGQRPDLVLSLILMFIISGVGFKLAMVPFHMWAPDAYEGAPTPVTGFLSVAPKAAAVGFLLRLLSNHEALGITPLLAVLAAVTMTVGNLGALHQTNVKRLLAYSSIAQVGYILVALVAGGSLGSQAAMVYTFIYLFMNLGVFAGLLMLSNRTRQDDVPSFAGLYQKSMGLSLAMVVFLLSLTGIPPFAGFVGKFAIFASIIQKPNLFWLAIVAVINSVVSLYYYFRIVHEMFFREPSDGVRPWFSPALVSCLALALGVTLVAGLLPNQILGWVRNVVGS